MSDKEARHLLVEFGCEELPSRWAGFLGRWLQTMIPRHPAMVHAIGGLDTDYNRDERYGLDFIAGPRRFGALLRYHVWHPEAQGGIVHGPRLHAPERAVQGFANRHGVALGELKERDGKYCVITPPPDLQDAFTTAVRDLIADTTSGKPWDGIIDDYLEKASAEFTDRYGEIQESARDIRLLSRYVRQVGNSYKVEQNRWPESPTGFVRPVRWITCMINDEAVPLHVFGCTASNTTYGHQSTRSIGNPLGQEIALNDASEYRIDLQDAQVLTSGSDHHRRVFLSSRDALYTADNPFSFRDTLKNTRFVRLPSALVASTLHAHLKARAEKPSEDSESVRYRFVSDLPPNVTQETKEHIKKGYRRVVNARLNDASFMLEQDIPSDDSLAIIEQRFSERLHNTTYIEGLGSQSDRITGVVQIVSKLAAQLAEAGVVEPSHWKELRGDLKLAAKWSLLDLGSQSVREAPSTHRIIAACALDHDKSRNQNRSRRVAAMLRYIYDPLKRFNSYDPDPFDTSTPESIGGITWNKTELQPATVQRIHFLLTVADSLYLVAGMAALDRLPSGSSDLLAVRRAAREICDYFVTHRLSSPSLEKLFDLAVDSTSLTPEEEGREVAKSRFCRFLEGILYAPDGAETFDAKKTLLELWKASYDAQDIHLRTLLAFTTHHSGASNRLQELFNTNRPIWLRGLRSRFLRSRKPLELAGHQWLSAPNQHARDQRITVSNWQYAVRSMSKNLWQICSDSKLLNTSPLGQEELLPAIEQRLNAQVMQLQQIPSIASSGDATLSQTWLELIGNTARRAAGLVDNRNTPTHSLHKLEQSEELQLDWVLDRAEALTSEIDAERDAPRHALRRENLAWAMKPSYIRDLPDELQRIEARNSKLFSEVVDPKAHTDLGILWDYNFDRFLESLLSLRNVTRRHSRRASELKTDFERLKLLVSIDEMLKRCTKLLDANPSSEDAKLLQDLYDELRRYTMQISEVDALVLRFHVVGVVCMAAQEFFELKIHHDVPAVRERRLALTRRLHAFIGKYLGTYA